MRKHIKSMIALLLLFLLLCPAASAQEATTLPAPDWITITLNKDSSKTIAVTTPAYMLDTVESYRYSIDGGEKWRSINYAEGGELLLDETATFLLKYITESGAESPVYEIHIEITKTTVIISPSTDISLVIPQNSSTPKDVTLSCYELISGVDYTAVQSQIGKNKPFRLFQVTLMRIGAIYSTDDSRLWIFPSGNFDAPYCSLYHVDENGRLEPVAVMVEMNLLYADTPLLGTFAVVEDKTFSKGDVNGDAKITAADARLALRASAQLEWLNDRQTAAADIDNNGSITAKDARLLLRISAGLETIKDVIK